MGEKFVIHDKVGSELSPGSVSRRWLPEGGEKKHKERIQRDSKFADDNKKLPFTFGKPYKPKGSFSLLKCDNCGAITTGTTATVSIVCSSCGKYSSVSVADS